ncbi:MAG: hypothetical protein LKI80_10930 [Sporolactobacillus sp.]|nr:hypothetical protein [Sporolactobacillus sp.]
MQKSSIQKRAGSVPLKVPFFQITSTAAAASVVIAPTQAHLIGHNYDDA